MQAIELINDNYSEVKIYKKDIGELEIENENNWNLPEITFGLPFNDDNDIFSLLFSFSGKSFFKGRLLELYMKFNKRSFLEEDLSLDIRDELFSLLIFWNLFIFVYII